MSSFDENRRQLFEKLDHCGMLFESLKGLSINNELPCEMIAFNHLASMGTEAVADIIDFVDRLKVTAQSNGGAA